MMRFEEKWFWDIHGHALNILFFIKKEICRKSDASLGKKLA